MCSSKKRNLHCWCTSAVSSWKRSWKNGKWKQRVCAERLCGADGFLERLLLSGVQHYTWRLKRKARRLLGKHALILHRKPALVTLTRHVYIINTQGAIHPYMHRSSCPHYFPCFHFRSAAELDSFWRVSIHSYGVMNWESRERLFDGHFAQSSCSALSVHQMWAAVQTAEL